MLWGIGICINVFFFRVSKKLAYLIYSAFLYIKFARYNFQVHVVYVFTYFYWQKICVNMKLGGKR